MITPTPLEKGAALIHEINSMLKNGIDPTRLDEIEQDARKLESSNFVSAKRVLGVIAGMRGDIAEIKGQFTAAIRAGGKEPATMANYATALSSVGDLVMASKIIDEAVEISPLDTTIIDKAILIHADAYDPDGMSHYIEHAQKLGRDTREDVTVIENTTIAAKEFIVQAGASLEQVADRVRVATEAIIDICGVPASRNVSLHDGMVMHQFVLETDEYTAMRAESAILDAIANKPFNAADRVMFFSCTTK